MVLYIFQLQIGIVPRGIESAICRIFIYTSDIQFVILVMDTTRTIIDKTFYITRSTGKEHILVIFENHGIGVLAFLTAFSIPHGRARTYRIFIRARDQISCLIANQIGVTNRILGKSKPCVGVFGFLSHKGFLLKIGHYITTIEELSGIGIKIDIGPITSFRIFAFFSKDRSSILGRHDRTGADIVIESRIHHRPTYFSLLIQFCQDSIAVVLQPITRATIPFSISQRRVKGLACKFQNALSSGGICLIISHYQQISILVIVHVKHMGLP